MSYGTLTDWIAYAAARGQTVADDAASAAALVRGADHIKYRYVARLNAPYDDTLEVVEPATYEAAWLELQTPGFFSTSYTPAQQKVLTEVKGIKWTVAGNTKGGWQDAMPESTLIAAMFEPYITDEREPQAWMRSLG